MRKKKQIHDPYLDEYLYHLIYAATRKQRERFDSKWNKVFQTARSAKAFCRRSTMEEKFYFLSLLGVEWFMILANKPTTTKDIKEILLKVNAGKANEAINDCIERRVFLLSSDFFLDYMGMMAKVEHSPHFKYNIELQKTGYHLGKWTKSVEYKEHKITEETKEYADNVIRFLFKSIMMIDSVESNFSIKKNDLYVLLYLFDKKHTFVPVEKIWDFFKGAMEKAAITQSIRRMRDDQYVRLSALTKKREYMITGLGIDLLHKFIAKTLSYPI